MIANALRERHRGQMLKHEKRLHRIRNVQHHGSYVLVQVENARGSKPLILPLDTEIEVQP